MQEPLTLTWATTPAGWIQLWECLTAACKAFSLANAKVKGVNELVVRSLDD
jgi:hypothetical protein